METAFKMQYKGIRKVQIPWDAALCSQDPGILLRMGQQHIFTNQGVMPVLRPCCVFLLAGRQPAFVVILACAQNDFDLAQM